MHRLRIVSIFFVHLFYLTIIPENGFAWSAKVVSVADGDTLLVIHNDQQVKVRLYGIDAPEHGQGFGQQAKALTAALVAGRNVDVEQKDTDQYGRMAALVKVDGQNLNELIIQNGYAWVYRQYCKERLCNGWMRSEEMARKQKRGMWAGSVVIPPWEWRAQMRREKQEEPRLDPSPPEIIIGQQQQAPAKDSWFSRIRQAFTPSSASKSEQFPSRFKCDGRIHCSQMTSCEEATFFLKNCPGVKMDGDGDGMPCEKQWCH